MSCNRRAHLDRWRTLRHPYVIEPSRTEIVRHESALGRWETAVRQPAAALRGYVRQYAGWFEHMAAPLCRRELPAFAGVTPRELLASLLPDGAGIEADW